MADEHEPVVGSEVEKPARGSVGHCLDGAVGASAMIERVGHHDVRSPVAELVGEPGHAFEVATPAAGEQYDRSAVGRTVTQPQEVPFVAD